MGYTKRTSFKTAITTGQISEFSLVLVILANKQGMFSGDLVSSVTVIALITIAVSTYLTMYNEQIYNSLARFLGIFEHPREHFERELTHHNDMILFGYQHGGHEFVKLFKGLKKPYVVIDYDPEVIELLEQQKFPAIFGDAMDIELLEEAGLDKAKLIVSTINDYHTDSFILELLKKVNAGAVSIIHTDSIEHALGLYEQGASYVILPHFVGSQQISSFIRKNGLSKKEFKHYREKHLAYLKQNYPLLTEI
jgi:hypothetical protein